MIARTLTILTTLIQHKPPNEA